MTYRKSLVKTKGSELNRLQKMLEGANIKLSGTVRDINGKNSRAFLSLLLDGKKIDASTIQEMYDRKEIANNLKASNAQLADDLNGIMTNLQRRLMKEVIRHIDELDEHIRNLDDDINNQMKDDEKKVSSAIQDITGIAEASASAIILVIGTDMGRFPTYAHFSSWAGLCPGNNESAKKRKSGKTCKGNALLRSTLVVGAHSAVKNKTSYFYAQFQRISVRRGKKQAYVAVAHSMLMAIYHVLKDAVAFTDLGSDYYNQFNKECEIKVYLKKLKALGWENPTTMEGHPA